MISAIVRCYNLTFMLDRVLRNLSDIDFVLLAICNYTDADEPSKVEAVVRDLNQNNVYCVHFPKMSQKDLFNNCIKRLSRLGSEIILINDSDEILLKDDRNRIIDKMLANATEYDAVNVSVIDYADMGCSERYEIRTHKPVVAIKPFAFFNGNRSVEQGALMDSINLHHFGYAMSQPEMDWKMNNLWYEKESAQKIINSRKEKANPPLELMEVLNESK